MVQHRDLHFIYRKDYKELKHDPKFAKVYLQEKKLLLGVLTGADPELMRRALEIVSIDK